MKLLLDINVLLDVILSREPWAAEAAQLLALIESGKASGYVAGHTVTTVHYVAAKALGRSRATAVVADVLRIVEVVPVEKDDFLQALALGPGDFEDAVQAACALKAGVDRIVTRNAQDFQGISIPAQPPGAILPQV